MVRHRAYVLGWYGHGNLGDESFKAAFKTLWSDVDFTFRDHLSDEVNTFDSLWVGGGSFLSNEIPGVASTDVKVPIYIVGVGVDPGTKPSSRKLLEKARLVIVRDTASLKHYPALVAPDLAFSIKTDPCYIGASKAKQVVILLNDFLTPNSDSPEWRSVAYQWFINQFSEACNALVEQGYVLHFMPMCTGDIDDRRISAAIVGRIKNKSRAIWYVRPVTFDELMTQLANSEFTITQRFHGIVFSTICGTPFISIRSHDKMQSLTKEMKWEGDLDYYGFNKLQLDQARRSVDGQRKRLLDFAHDKLVEWACISDTVKRGLSL